MVNNSFPPPGILAKLTHGRGYRLITCLFFMLKTDWLGDPPIPNDDLLNDYFDVFNVPPTSSRAPCHGTLGTYLIISWFGSRN